MFIKPQKEIENYTHIWTFYLTAAIIDKSNKPDISTNIGDLNSTVNKLDIISI